MENLEFIGDAWPHKNNYGLWDYVSYTPYSFYKHKQMTISEIKQRLKEGNKRFVADMLDGKLQDSKRRKQLATGQEPHTIVLSCSDSRVVPELVFDTGLGEIFVIRVAGNIAHYASIASIEYAVANLSSKVLVVMGHQSCGAVQAALKGGNNGYNLNLLISHIQPAIANCGNNVGVDEVVKENARISVENIKEHSKIIRDALKKDELEILPAFYNLHTGKVDFLD